MRTLGIVITINVLKHSKRELLLGVVTSPVSFFKSACIVSIVSRWIKRSAQANGKAHQLFFARRSARASARRDKGYASRSERTPSKGSAEAKGGAPGATCPARPTGKAQNKRNPTRQQARRQPETQTQPETNGKAHQPRRNYTKFRFCLTAL